MLDPRRDGFGARAGLRGGRAAGRGAFGGGRSTRSGRALLVVLTCGLAITSVAALSNSGRSLGGVSLHEASSSPSVVSRGDGSGVPAAAPRNGLPPSSGGFRTSGGVHPAPYSVDTGTEPAPMGLADFGSEPGGGSYSYETDSFQGTISIASLSTYNASIGGGEESSMSFQLNAFLGFTSGGTDYVYWVQDVLSLNSASGAVEIYDNIWNATSQPLPEIAATAVHGNGSISGFSIDGLEEQYYGDASPCSKPGACVDLVYGSGGAVATVVLQLNASLVAGKPTVKFLYDDGYGLASFDTATFSFPVAPAEFQGFFVNAGALSSGCVRCVGDVELIAGGPNSGYQTSISGTTDVTFSIGRWNGHNYESVPDAYDHGAATAEGLENATVGVSANGFGEPLAVLTNGPGSLGPLWGKGSLAIVGVSVVNGASGGDLAVNGTSVPYAGGYVEVTLIPGLYDLSVDSDGTYALGDVDLLGGEYLTLEVGPPGVVPIVFVPTGLGSNQVWSVTLFGATSNETLNGTGNITFGAAAGNYSYTVAALSGLAPSPSTGNVSVNASTANVAVPIRWTSTQTSYLSGILAVLDARVGPLPVYVILLLLVILVIALAVATRRPPSRTRFMPAPSPPPMTGWTPGSSPYAPAPPEPPHRSPPS